MASLNEQQVELQGGSGDTLIREIPFSEDYELAFYTLRRLRDGHLQSYMLPLNSNDQPVEARPIATQLLRAGLPEESEEVRQEHLLQPYPYGDNNPYRNRTPVPQTFNIPIRGGRDNPLQLETRHREPSVQTLIRRARARDDGYTIVCGVFSPEIATPVKMYHHGNGEFCCPRCDSNYTRPKTVKDHFPNCVSKYGNPHALRFTDHPSMVDTEFAIQNRLLTSRRRSIVRVKEQDAEMDLPIQGMEFGEMRAALALASLPLVQERGMSRDDVNVKTESVLGADIPRQSIETPAPERHFQPTFLHDDYNDSYPISTSSRRRHTHVAQTPEWQMPFATGYGLKSSTPTPHSNPWNVGIPGSATEQAMMDMRATAPFEGWDHPVEASEPTYRDGTQFDGLDDFMDRRSYRSATPTAPRLPALGTLFEEIKMEE